MATTLVLLFTLLFSSLLLTPTLQSSQTHASEFIRSKCSSTEYPKLCIDSLSSYAPTINNNPLHLATAALSITLKSAESAFAMIGRLSTMTSSSSKQGEAVSDCVRSLSDSVKYLEQSLKEFEKINVGSSKGNKKEVEARVGDVQTWVSTALTDESSCMDAFGPGGKVEGVKGPVKKEVVRVTKLTCNALGLISGVATSA